MNVINIKEKFGLFDEHWSPRILGELNGQLVKLAKLKDDFVWHSHEHEDELFMIMKGTLVMEFRDRVEHVKEGEIIIVPRGVEHNPHTLNGEEVWVLLFEPAATKHTGEVAFERAVENQEWI